MDTEKIVKEIKDLSYGIQFHREQGDFHHGVADKRLASVIKLEAKLAEDEKPKLQHGDIRMWHESVAKDVAVIDLSEATPHAIWEKDDRRNSWTEDQILARSKSIGNLKEVFKEIKALSEPLKKFTVDNGPFSTVEVTIQSGGFLRLQDEDGYIMITKCDLAAFILNLRRLLHTAEQAKNT